MGKIIETRNLYKNTINSITQNADNWLSFLKTASWNFKYSFEDQILIYAQNPNATACAEMEYWNEKLHRWVNKNANAITENVTKPGSYYSQAHADIYDPTTGKTRIIQGKKTPYFDVK